MCVGKVRMKRRRNCKDLQGSAGTYGERETAVIFLTGLSAIFNPGFSKFANDINQRLCEEKLRRATATHKICLRKTYIRQNNNESVPRIENVLWQEGEEGGGHG